MGKIRTNIVSGKRGGMKKDAVIEAQLNTIRDLKRELKEVHEKLEQQERLFAEVRRERDFFEKCLKSAENALQYKEKVIDKQKKKWSKRLAEKKEVVETLTQEIGSQCKRRERAEKIVALVCELTDSFAEKAGKILEAYGE